MASCVHLSEIQSYHSLENCFLLRGDRKLYPFVMFRVHESFLWDIVSLAH